MAATVPVPLVAVVTIAVVRVAARLSAKVRRAARHVSGLPSRESPKHRGPFVDKEGELHLMEKSEVPAHSVVFRWLLLSNLIELRGRQRRCGRLSHEFDSTRNVTCTINSSLLSSLVVCLFVCLFVVQ